MRTVGALRSFDVSVFVVLMFELEFLTLERKRHSYVAPKIVVIVF